MPRSATQLSAGAGFQIPLAVPFQHLHPAGKAAQGGQQGIDPATGQVVDPPQGGHDPLPGPFALAAVFHDLEIPIGFLALDSHKHAGLLHQDTALFPLKAIYIKTN
jgi:hypothetical protein